MTDRMDIVHKVREVLDKSCKPPAVELIALGEALIAIGEALQGIPIDKARKIIEAVAILEGIKP